MLKPTFDVLKPYSFAIYARMSSDKQNPRSPDQQVETILANLKCLRYPWIHVDTYRDDAISGRTSRRPGYQQLFADLRSGKLNVDLVLVDTFERLTRADDASDVRSQFRKLGVHVLTADSNFADPTSVSGKALNFVESMRATEDGRVKAHNVLRGKKDGVRRGGWPGGPAPLGYRLENVMVQRNDVEEIDYRQLVPDPVKGPLVQRMFELADEHGFGSTRIAQSLNADPNVPADLKPFVSTTVGRILRSPLYVGTLVWNRHATGIVDDVRIKQANAENEWIMLEGFCDPLVTRERWDRVQQLCAARAPRNGRLGTGANAGALVPRPPGVALRYPLSGLVRCSHCQRTMTINRSSPFVTLAGEERTYAAYFCPGSASGACSNRTRVPEVWLRQQVTDLLRQELFLNQP